jgi:hypothetical protein
MLAPVLVPLLLLLLSKHSAPKAEVTPVTVAVASATAEGEATGLLSAGANGEWGLVRAPGTAKGDKGVLVITRGAEGEHPLIIAEDGEEGGLGNPPETAIAAAAARDMWPFMGAGDEGSLRARTAGDIGLRIAGDMGVLTAAGEAGLRG